MTVENFFDWWTISKWSWEKCDLIHSLFLELNWQEFYCIFSLIYVNLFPTNVSKCTFKKVRVTKRKLLWIFKAIIWQRFWEFIFWFSGHGNGQRSFSFTLCAQKSANQACDSFCSAFLKMQENRKIVQRSFFMSISNQKI